MTYNDHYKRAPIILERTMELRVLRGHFHSGRVQRKDMDKAIEPDGQCLWRSHSGILCQCHCGRGSHKLLAERERVLCHKGVNSRYLGGSSNDSSHIPTIWWEKGETRTHCGSPWWSNQQKGLAQHSTHSGDENFGLHMSFNLYLVRNLTNLSAPRSIFLFDLFTHKEINIYNHIYHLFTKCITKRNSRLTLPFPSLIMSIITRANVKILSRLQVMQRDYPISAQTMTWSKAHIPGLSVSVSQIPRDNVAEEGGDIEEEIENFTSIPEDTAQPSSQTCEQHPIILII